MKGGGLGKYAPIKLWEMELMLALQMTEEQYSAIPKKERARMVAGLKLPKLIESLETDKAMRKSKNADN